MTQLDTEPQNFFLRSAILSAIRASNDIFKIYQTDFKVDYKEDYSPVTIADKTADETIRGGLSETELYILSEEQQPLSFENRKSFERLWIVDPLDGTKEFIKRNDEFTVNIALIDKGMPVLGVITAPAKRKIWWGLVGNGGYYNEVDSWDQDIDVVIQNSELIVPQKKYNVVGSRSHKNVATSDYIDKLLSLHEPASLISTGSSLKMCKVATGEAGFYPRFSPINEWDIAAGTAIIESTEGSVIDAASRKPVVFNKEVLTVSPFIAISRNVDQSDLP